MNNNNIVLFNIQIFELYTCKCDIIKTKLWQKHADGMELDRMKMDQEIRREHVLYCMINKQDNIIFKLKIN